MEKISQVKNHYCKDILSFRQLSPYLYKIHKSKPGYVIGVVNASEIVDNGFWNNDGLSQQFDVKIQQSSGSRFFDGVVDIVKDTSVEKQIEEASEESTGKLVIYVPEGDDRIVADMIFHNKSKNRNLDDASIKLGGSLVKMSLKTRSANSGPKSFEDVITFDVGDFSFFKESVIGNELTLYFNVEEDEDGEARDYLSIRFNINVPLVDVLSVDYIVNGNKWEESKTGRFLPAIETGMKLSDEQSRLDGLEIKIKKGKKKAKWISWIAVFVVLNIGLGIYPDMEGLAAFLILGVFIGIGMSWKIIAKKLNADKERELRENDPILINRKKELDNQLRNSYMAVLDTVSDVD